jgi:RES domain-containing protein
MALPYSLGHQPLPIRSKSTGKQPPYLRPSITAWKTDGRRKTPVKSTKGATIVWRPSGTTVIFPPHTCSIDLVKLDDDLALAFQRLGG